ncbi:polysaccharide deacetylase family protein [Bacillus sp. FJAT-45037]|uniref:polysaccharide deacetylase family protein n=1 Tax=Bacillus sp. FJAT-45037 TaxID=2011007 RepID=UPI000C24850C|nr:polysaccharide deacetylase family protein [Bacillus sp. FJAT-45037]
MKQILVYSAIVALISILLLGCSNAFDTSDDVDSTEPIGDELDNNEKSEEVEREAEINNKDENTEDAKEEDVNLDKEDEVELMYEINPNNWKVEPINGADPKVVLLTIDDAPNQYGLDMAKQLKDLGTGAIFFVNGHFIRDDEGQEALKEIYEMGFEIGNHTMNHPNLNQLAKEEQYEEIVALNDLIEEIIGERPRFFRAPFGVNTDESNQIVADEGMVMMNWTYGYDWEAEYTEANALADIMVNTPYLSEGANLLMHDREWTSEALTEIVQGLKNKGYNIVDPKTIKGLDE